MVVPQWKGWASKHYGKHCLCRKFSWGCFLGFGFLVCWVFFFLLLFCFFKMNPKLKAHSKSFSFFWASSKVPQRCWNIYLWPKTLWISSFINFHFFSVCRHTLIHRHAIERAVSRGSNATHKGPMMILNYVKRRIIWQFLLPIHLHFFHHLVNYKPVLRKGGISPIQ